MVICSVSDCKHYSEQRKCKFLVFPETMKKKKKHNLRTRPNGYPSDQSMICSCHFKNNNKKSESTMGQTGAEGKFKFISLKNGFYEMETLETIEENGGSDPLSTAPDSPIASSVKTTEHLETPPVVAATNMIVQLILPQGQAQVQSVIQPNQQSVIQTAANLQPVLGKSNVFLVSSKPSSVIQTPQGSLQTLRVLQAETASDDSLSDDETAKKRRDSLKRRPSYRKILNDLGAGEITEPKVEQTSSEGDSELSSELSSHSIPYHTVLPGTAIQISSGEGSPGIHALTMTNSTAGGAIVQYSSGQEIFVPVVPQGATISSPGNEDQARKREMRLLKNREAARECRRKKKEYIKCLENRVAVLENQNKTLIEELKELKELYCQHKPE